MKKASLQSALQIWPNPPGGYDIKTGWTWIKVKFHQNLSSDETYLLTLDKTAQDLRGNALAATYVLAFSTGDHLNSGQIRGTIYGNKSIKQNGDLLLYRQFNRPLIELREQAADYVFQPDDDGHFRLSYLAEQPYLLFYHWDSNHNKRIDGDDYFGRPVRAVVQARSDSSQVDHGIWPQPVPLPGLKLLEVSELGDHFIKIRTARPWTEQSLSEFKLFADDQPVPVSGATRVPDDAFALHVDLGRSLRDSAQVWLQNFRDTSGFSLHSDTLQFIKAGELDTLSLLPFEISWQNQPGSDQISDSSLVLIRGKLPFLFQSDSAFQLFDQAIDSVAIEGNLDQLSSMTWAFSSRARLADGRTYQWQIASEFIQSPLNGYALDSLIQGRLSSVSEDSLGSIRIRHMGVEELECRLVSTGIERSFRLKPGVEYLISDLPARKYKLTAFVDSDGNGLYSSGGMDLKAGAELFWVYPDEIKVRARWETDLGLWRYKK